MKSRSVGVRFCFWLFGLVLIPTGLVFAQAMPFQGAADTKIITISATPSAVTIGSQSEQLAVTVDSDITACIQCETSQPTPAATPCSSAQMVQGKGTGIWTVPKESTQCVVTGSGAAVGYFTRGIGN